MTKLSLIQRFCAVFLFSSNLLTAQYSPKGLANISKGEVAISKPGNYGIPGTVYKLSNDISSPGSAVFLGKDVTLDLNGYTITFADAGYENVPNYSFEDGLEHWDVVNAPGAKIEDTKVHVFVGDKILRLSKGEEIVSPYINLPVAGRSYMAMCGVTKPEMKVSIYVEDEMGQSVVCNTDYSDGTRQSCPIEKRSPRLGGGFVLAHLNGIKAGKYRVRVKADTDCLIDFVDIRPAMDVGIGIVDNTIPMGHNDHMYEGRQTAFFDYTSDVSLSVPVKDIPRVKGKGTVTIKNGIIKNGAPGVISWGIQSTAEDVTIILDNVKIINSGINAIAVDVPQAIISRCTFDVQNPFIINRHGSSFYAVDLRGDKSSEVSYSEFYGGQGCLVFKGAHSKIHHNLFVNRQTVTNHYSIMAMGDSSLVFENVIRPEVGSGIEVYVHRGMEIFNNEIHVEAAPPTCEYGHEDYSTTALRIADYNAPKGSPKGSFGNKVYNNRIYVTGKDSPEYLDYIPMAWAVFYSSSAGDNYIYGNDIWVEDLTPGLKNETSAFYVGGGTIGGQFFDNRITTNVPAAWVASRYGGAKAVNIYRNAVIKSDKAGDSFNPFRMGWDERKDCVANDIEFRSNMLEGLEFGIDATEQSHSYSVWWTLKINVTDNKGSTTKGVDVLIQDKNGKKVACLLVNEQGFVQTELPEYTVNGKKKVVFSPYTIVIGEKKEDVCLGENTEINIKY